MWINLNTAYANGLNSMKSQVSVSRSDQSIDRIDWQDHCEASGACDDFNRCFSFKNGFKIGKLKWWYA